MTQIEQIKAEIGESDCLYGYSPENRSCDFCGSSLCDVRKLPKIKGWVARDKRGTLNFFRAHPRRITDSRGEEYWIGHVRMKQPNEFFPDLKWEDDPIEVELTIHRV